MNKILSYMLSISIYISSNLNCMVNNKEIFDATQSGDHQKVEKLLSKEPSLANARDKHNCTPLHIAAKAATFKENNNTGAAKGYIISYLSNPPEPPKMGSPTKVAQLLLKYKADVNAQTNDQETPMHYAMDNGDITKILLEHKGTHSPTDYWSYTPLQYATIGNHINVVYILLQYGANPNVGKYFHERPTWWAKRFLHRQVEQLLNDWPLYQSYRKRTRQERLLAFCMAQHEHLGGNSPAKILPKELYIYIAELLTKESYPSIGEMHEMVQREYNKQQIEA